MWTFKITGLVYLLRQDPGNDQLFDNQQDRTEEHSTSNIIYVDEFCVEKKP